MVHGQGGDGCIACLSESINEMNESYVYIYLKDTLGYPV